MPNDFGDSLTLAPQEINIFGFEWTITTTCHILWIAVKYGRNIHVPHKMDCKNFGDPLMLHLVLSSGQSFTHLGLQ